MNKYIKRAIEVVYETIKQEQLRPIPHGVLVSKIKKQNSSIKTNDIYTAIDYLLEEKIIKLNQYNKLILDYIEYPEDTSEYLEGEVTNINSRGSAFISVFDDENNRISYFVHKLNLNGALVGDKVLFVKLIKENIDLEKESINAKIIKILERTKNVYSAAFTKNSIIIDDSKFYLKPSFDKKYEIPNNSKILVELVSNNTRECVFKLIKIIGPIGTKGVDIDSIILDSGFKLNFPEEVNRISEKITWEVSEKDKKLRRDIRNRHIISIDPFDSKDMDDAIYVEKQPDGNFFLSVSIADVSHYVKQNTILDKDALTKCTSVYLVDRVLPMLHHNLSNNLCSLNPNVERFCLTCDMLFSPSGNLLKKELYPAIMINYDRLSYDVVNEYFEGDKKAINSSLTQKILDDAFELYKIIRNKKYNEGYVDLDIKEPKIICDENGNPIEIYFKPRGDAQRLIEDFMIACNEAVTMIADELELPFVYRVHDKPDPLKITKLTTELKKLRFKHNLNIDNGITPIDFTNLLNMNSDSPNLDILNILILKSMQKAQYSPNNIGHFGLASKQYTHFTSPIRRYSDLIVHRIFWMYVFDKESYTNDERIELVNNLSEYTKLCNEKEILAIELERDVAAYKIAEFMEKFIGKIFEAKITTVTAFGLFVELDNTVEGLVPIKSLDDDFYVYNPDEMILVGKRNQKIYTLGMNVKVKLENASKRTRKIDFVIVGNKNENISIQ